MVMALHQPILRANQPAYTQNESRVQNLLDILVPVNAILEDDVYETDA